MLRRAEEERMRMPDTLRVVTLSGATIYFTIRGEEMGYQYDLLRLYSQERDIPYKLSVLPNLDSIHSELEQGKAHLSITPEAVTKQNQEKWLFTGPTSEHALVLVQRKARSPRDSAYVRDVTGLIGKKLYVLSGSSHEQRLNNLGEQLGAKLDVHLVESDTVNSEDLIAMVAADSIGYTIVDAELAQLAQKYYPNTDISLQVGFPQRLRWLSTERFKGLALDINSWSEQASLGREAKGIYRKYFEAYGVPITQEPSLSHFTEPVLVPKGAISPYDNVFKSQGSSLPWSWHILAAIAYHESRFQASIVGWSGARGLMGIMPATGRIYGAQREELLQPEVSVRVAIRCLRDTEEAFRSIANAEQRLKFTLAAYNAGVGHIQDAQRLAKKYGYDPSKWDNHVERCVLLKSEQRYYNDPVCKYGYLRGKETYRYANEVYALYHAYKKSKGGR